MKEMSTYVNETNFLEAFRCKPHLVASMVYYDTGVLLPFVRGPLYPGHVNQQNVEPGDTKSNDSYSNLQRRGSVYINPNYIIPPMQCRKTIPTLYMTSYPLVLIHAMLVMVMMMTLCMFA